MKVGKDEKGRQKQNKSRKVKRIRIDEKELNLSPEQQTTAQ